MLDEEKNGAADTSNQQGGDDSNSSNSGDSGNGGDDNKQEPTAEELKKQLADEKEATRKANEIAENQRIRAEKAERKGKGDDKKPDANAQAGLSDDDLYALVDAKVPRDDVNEVKEYAKLKKISITEALKSSVVKTILKENAEKRASAEAANTGTAKRGTTKATGEQLVDTARTTGELPESEEDMRNLAESRRKKPK